MNITLIDYVSYSHSALENSDTATEKKTYAGNIWSVPYIITTINNVSVRNVKEARSAFDKVLQQTYQEAYYEHHISIKEKLSILEEELFHRLGIVDKELINGEKYIEYVQSLGDTTKFECNYVMEFFVRNIVISQTQLAYITTIIFLYLSQGVCLSLMVYTAL